MVVGALSIDNNNSSVSMYVKVKSAMLCLIGIYLFKRDTHVMATITVAIAHKGQTLLFSLFQESSRRWGILDAIFHRRRRDEITPEAWEFCSFVKFANSHEPPHKTKSPHRAYIDNRMDPCGERAAEGPQQDLLER
ncbi:hypothetical protein RB195_020603 [Necator americanus]|uniref:Uncharacterized protein n=1 Tax=Necator americanus TaxID=51031 RepID=A0ABR1CKV9_NECAM